MSTLVNLSEIEKEEGVGIRCFGCNQPLCETEEQVLSICLKRGKSTCKATANLLSAGIASKPTEN